MTTRTKISNSGAVQVALTKCYGVAAKSAAMSREPAPLTMAEFDKILETFASNSVVLKDSLDVLSRAINGEEK